MKLAAALVAILLGAIAIGYVVRAVLTPVVAAAVQVKAMHDRMLDNRGLHD
jgi:hypothetical protein